jgi:hypothetical protein
MHCCIHTAKFLRWIYFYKGFFGLATASGRPIADAQIEGYGK